MRITLLLVASILVVLTIASPAKAQSLPSETIETLSAGGFDFSTDPSRDATLLSVWVKFSLAAGILLLGAIVIFLEYRFLAARNLPSDNATQLFCLTLIIIGTIFIIVIGFKVETITPAVGLFGTIAGYLLGQTVK